MHRITSFDLASRLSFFLTGRGPDEELLRLAERGTLAEPAVLDAQVKRLLAAPTSHSLVNTFAFQWLKMRSLDEIEPDAVDLPELRREPARRRSRASWRSSSAASSKKTAACWTS